MLVTSYELLGWLTNLGILPPSLFHIGTITNVVAVCNTATDLSLTNENLDKFCLAQIPSKRKTIRDAFIIVYAAYDYIIDTRQLF